VIKTLTKHGNSLALILDKPILELLNIDADTPISISTDGRALTLSPVKDEIKAQREMNFDDALEWVNENYKESLSRLAK